MPTFDCKGCGEVFDVPRAALDKYPGWTPKICLKCRDQLRQDGTPASKAPKPSTRGSRSGNQAKPGRAAAREDDLTVAEVLAKYTDGPKEGVFTDGAANPNPGPGGWGAVYVKAGKIVAETFGHEAHTTNNRMELTALLEGMALVPRGEAATLYTDSQLCVNTLTKWAQGWEKNGWKRKTGEIKNLDLVKKVYKQLKNRPELQIRWIKAHSGFLWNEYADALATAYRRETK